jgi:Zn-dependent protease with chaperone function
MSASPSVAGRALLAVALMIGFYVLALGIAGGLLAVPYFEFRETHGVNVRIALFCGLGAFAILSALVPRRDKFVEPGPKLDPDDQPDLFQVVRSVAAKTGQEMPRDVYLVGDVNAWVAQRGGVMGIGSRRVMGIGLALLQLVSVSELRAVLAHEFGHFDGGDTKLGPWIYKTRTAIGRTLASLARHNRLLVKPFHWYGKLFLRITHAVSRRQELAADSLACRVEGVRPLVGGLRAIHGAAPAFRSYWQGEVMPILNAGFAPPIADGFRQFVRSDRIANAVSAHVERQLREAKTDPYDTHPPLRERIVAVEQLPRSPARAALDRDEPAAALLRDVGTLEQRLLAALGPKAVAAKLVPITWERSGEALFAPSWQTAVRANARAFGAMTAIDIHAAASTDVDAFAERLVPLPKGTEQRRAAARWMLGAGLGHVLHREGWRVVASPGEEIRLQRDDDSREPFALVNRIVQGSLSLTEWSTLCGDLGIASTPIWVGSTSG